MKNDPGTQPALLSIPVLMILLIVMFALLYGHTARAEGNQNKSTRFSTTEVLVERDGMTIYGELLLPEKEGPLPLVILCHGFGGNYGHMKAYAQAFARKGVAAYSFDFIGGGLGIKSDGTMKEMSVLTEAADLNAVLDQMMALPAIDADRIFLLGASQGGFVSSYVAGTRPDDIAGLIALYPAYVLQDNAWKQTPDPDKIPETITLMGVTLGRIYNADAMSFDIYDIIPNYPGKVLIIHGTADAVAPISYSERAVKVFPDAKLIRYKGANHGFWGQDEINSENQAVSFVLDILDSLDNQ